MHATAVSGITLSLPAHAHAPKLPLLNARRAGLADGLVNKVPVAMNMSPQLYTYLLDHTREPQVCMLMELFACMHGCINLVYLLIDTSLTIVRPHPACSPP
jgi:hypothetical protein